MVYIKNLLIKVLKYCINKLSTKDLEVPLVQGVLTPEVQEVVHKSTIDTLERVFNIKAWKVGNTAEDWAYQSGQQAVVEFLRRDYESGGKLLRERGKRTVDPIVSLRSK